MLLVLKINSYFYQKLIIVKILVVSATIFEIAPLLNHFDKNCKAISFYEFQNEKHSFFPLVTGVGSVNTALSLCRYSDMKNIDVAINLGLAGAFDKNINLGDVFEIEKDRFGDLGVEEANGSFTDVHELDLIGKDYHPFENGWLINDKNKLELTFPKKIAITVNKVHGTKNSIEAIDEKYNADLESMEGAAFMQACKTMDVKFHQIRAVSNYVEPRNRANWKLELAIDNLNAAVIKMLS